MNVVIFANGELTSTAAATHYSKQAELIIAVDGGANHCRKLGILPQILIGDLDSIEPELAHNYEQNNVIICRYLADKDKTDLELALDLAIEKQAEKITIFAALGGRWDMSFANLLLLAAPEYAGVEILFVEQETTIGICREGEEKHLSFLAGTTVSFLPLNGNVGGVTLTGFKYPLTDQTLKYSSTRGVSNVLIEPPGKIIVKAGILLWMALAGEVLKEN